MAEPEPRKVLAKVLLLSGFLAMLLGMFIVGAGVGHLVNQWAGYNIRSLPVVLGVAFDIGLINVLTAWPKGA